MLEDSDTGVGGSQINTNSSSLLILNLCLMFLNLSLLILHLRLLFLNLLNFSLLLVILLHNVVIRTKKFVN